jgi:hypothetical protein
MISAICAELKNYFVKSVTKGTFVVEGGGIDLPDIQNGQYIRIIGSVFNDGVYKYPCNNLTDESFTGEVWAMAIPPALIALADQIKTYAESEPAKPSPYISESFGGYTYTRSTDEYGTAASWQKVFRSQLNRWRKL